MIIRLLISLLMLGCMSTDRVWSQQENVLLVIADDLGVDSLNLFVATDGSPTPTLDSLASSGIRFTNFWGSPSCAPARAQILTGRYAFRTGVGEVGAVPSLDEGTIAQAFSAANYATACIGKWHLADQTNGNRDNPNLMGFNHYNGNLGGGLSDYFSWTRVENGVTVNNANNPVTEYATSATASEASDWIQQQGDNPWFCWVAFNAPHSPFHLPPNNLHTATLPGNPAHIAANQRSYYLAMIEAMDTEIGRLLSEMAPDVRANTYVVFVGDNGTPGPVTPTPGVVAGSKGTLFQGGVNVPCIVSGPGVANPGRTHEGLVSLADLFTTLLDLTGTDASFIPDGAATDSLSFAPYVTDADANVIHTCQFSERFTTPPHNNDGKTVRLGDWKLIRSDNGNESFYNLPNEALNLANGSLTPEEQAIFDMLNLKLDQILAGPFMLGDINRDGVVSFLDISPFIALLSSGDYQHEADMDQNNNVNFQDISPFILALSQ